MSQIFNEFKELVMSFTYQKKREKQLEVFRDKAAHYKTMDEDELEFEYINCRVQYEHLKNVLALIVITIAVSFITDIWGKMFSFLNAAVKYSNNTENVRDTFMVCCIISAIVMAALTVVVITVLSMMFNELRTLKKELEIIKYVRQAEEENED